MKINEKIVHFYQKHGFGRMKINESRGKMLLVKLLKEHLSVLYRRMRRKNGTQWGKCLVV